MSHILIAGAGMGGLTAALCLKRAGINVTVFERSAELSEAGAGIQLGPNAMHVLDALGLRAEIDKAAVQPEAVTLRHYKTGKSILRVALGQRFKFRYGNDYLHLHRADLQSVLLQAAKDAGITLRLGHTVTSANRFGDCVTLQTSQGEYDGDVLIAADGIRSTLRQSLFGTVQTKFSGRIAWRALIDPSKLDVPLTQHTHNWVGPGRHVVAYYVRNGSLINLVAVEDDQDWAADSWVEPGDKSELLRHFEGWDATVIEILSACDAVYKWGLFDREPLLNWTQGRIAILADAAHPMLPFMAQGASMAIEDGWVLAHMLSTNPVETALKSFETARKPRTSLLQKISRENASLYHADGVAALWRNIKLSLAHHIPPLQNIPFDRIYKSNVVQDYPLELAA